VAKKNVWVTKEPEGWAVRLGRPGALGRFPTQKEAIAAGRGRAKRDRVELICWQGRNGQIAGRNRYGHDPEAGG
jgi:hypothetical protein